MPSTLGSSRPVQLGLGYRSVVPRYRFLSTSPRRHLSVAARSSARQGRRTTTEEEHMAELMVDVITSLDGFSSAEGWPGLWGLGGPDYFAWLAEDGARARTTLMGAT